MDLQTSSHPTSDSATNSCTFDDLDLEWSSKTSSSPVENDNSEEQIEKSAKEKEKLITGDQQAKPKRNHLTLLFGADAEERISAQPFCSNRNRLGCNADKEAQVTTLSYYDFPPEEEANLLAMVHPATSQLTVAIADYDDCLLLKVVRQLVSKVLAHSLTSVQLFIRFSNCPDFQLCAVHCLSLFYLLESFNSLSGLQHLTLVVEHPVFSTVFAKNACHLDMSFLARLSEFYFCTTEALTATPVLHWLAKSVSSQQRFFFFSLHVLALGQTDPSYSLVDFLGSYPLFGPTIVELPAVLWFVEPLFALQTFHLLPRLVHLNLKAHSTIHFFELLSAAASQLTHLQSMSITLDTASPATGHCPLYQFGFDATALPRFSLLKSLKLVANVHSHGDLQSSLWGAVFPAMERLELEHNCITCKICPTRNHGTLCLRAQRKIAKIMEECLFRTFKQCPKLSTISAKKNYKWAQSYVLTEVNGQKVPLKTN